MLWRHIWACLCLTNAIKWLWMIPEGELRLIFSCTTPTIQDHPYYTVLLYCMMKIWTKWPISVLADTHILLPFTRIIVKTTWRVILGWKILSRWLLGVFSQNTSNSYYEPIIMVHEYNIQVYWEYLIRHKNHTLMYSVPGLHAYRY